MQIGPRLELRHSQLLVMTPQLRQAIKLLQYSNQDVAAFIQEELERNPLLEVEEAEQPAPDRFLPRGGGQGGSGGFDGEPRALDLAESRPALRDHLWQQLRLACPDRVDRLIGGQLIALLDGAGRVAMGDGELADAMGVEPDRVATVRALMLRFEPVGLFARDLRECLAAQLADRNRLDLPMELLLDNLDLLARRDLRRLRAACGCEPAELMEMIAELKRLDPKPGTALDVPPLQPLIPDVLMRTAADGSWQLELNPASLPRVLVNETFRTRVARRGAPREDRAWLSERLGAANWLVRSLQQRAQTILKVAAEIVRRQDGFFRHGVPHLVPLVLRDVAAEVELHESTVSRVTANKYIATPRGIYEFRYFFTAAINGTSGISVSAEAVRHRIRAIVEAEDVTEVMSDDAIVAALRREGVDIARRTVAKYRDALRIPGSTQRRREKAVPA